MPGDGAEDRTKRAESEGKVVRDRDPVVSRIGGFQDNVTADLVHLVYRHRRHKKSVRCPPETSRGSFMRPARSRREQGGGGFGQGAADKKERRGRLKYILAQLVPLICFREDAFRKAFGTVAAIRLLHDLEHQFRHTSMIRHAFARAGVRAPLGAGGAD